MAVLRVITQFFPNVPDMYHDQIVGRVEKGFVPDTFVDILDREYFLRMGCQKVQDAVFNIRKRDLLPVLTDQALIRIDLNIPAAADQAGFFLLFGTI